MSKLSINRYLDHAVLKPEMSREETIDAIKLGIDYNVRTVCVKPCDIDLAIELCEGTETEVSCVLSFPHGSNPSSIKQEEAKLYIEKGAKEIDMVANYGWIKSGLWDLVEEDIKNVSKVTRAKGVLLKVIFETAVLTPEEISKTTEICIKANADYVKTSTGFNGEGANEENVKIMLDTAKDRIKVKASGGIRDRKTAEMFINMGCERLGNGYSSTPDICK